MATASYWMVIPAQDGNPAAFMWNCEACPALGVQPDEAETVASMNAHMADAHPNSDYVAPPVPE